MIKFREKKEREEKYKKEKRRESAYDVYVYSMTDALRESGADIATSIRKGEQYTMDIHSRIARLQQVMR